MENGKYDSVTVARFIIAKANEKGCPVNMTKVQKLLYIAYGIFLAVKDERLTDEHPQAWPYGPVFPRTRNKLLKTDFYGIGLDDPGLAGISSDDETVSLINLVFRSFGNWSASQLSEWSHSEGSPWERAVSSDGFKWGDRIPDEYISSFFKSRISPQ